MERKTLGVEQCERVTVSRKYGAEHRAVCCLQKREHRERKEINLSPADLAGNLPACCDG